MSAFSYTAPLFTEEDRQFELASLTDAKRDLIENYKLGTGVAGLDGGGEKEIASDEKQESSLIEMQEELEKIPLQDKIDYTEAMIRVPNLVEEESPMLNFLRKHQYNACEAAQNLTLYWKWRVQLFGKEKSFSPMTIRGALQDDFDTLSTGFCQILPHDSHGRIVMYHDKSKASNTVGGSSNNNGDDLDHHRHHHHHHRDGMCRVLFYMFHVASMDEKAQLNGCVCIVNAKQTKMKDLDRLYTKTSTCIINNVTSVRCNAMHISSPKMWIIPASVVLPICQFVTPRELRLKTHFFEDLDELSSCGMLVENLPTSLGGRYDTNEDAFQCWLEDRIQKENSFD